MTDEEILNIDQKYQGRAIKDIASMLGEVHYDIQALLCEINSFHIKLEAMEIERSHYFKWLKKF